MAISLGYRLLATGPCGGSGPVPHYRHTAAEAAQHDAQAAVRFVRKNATFLGVDPNRIAMAGESAGAVTSLRTTRHQRQPWASVRHPRRRLGRGRAADRPLHLSRRRPGLVLPRHRRPDRALTRATGNVSAMAQQDLIVGIEPFNGEGHGILGPHRNVIHEQASHSLYFMMDLAHAAR